MNALSHEEFETEALERLAELVEQTLHHVRPRTDLTAEMDAVVVAGETAFLLQCRTATYMAALHHAIRLLKAGVSRARERGLWQHVVPVLAVPFMGPSGRRLCRDEDCSWLDLSGNASIRAPGVLARVEGNANRFKRRGRRASAFAPVASRVTRQLLMNHAIDLSQRQLARRVDMDEGYVSRVVRNLAEQELVAKYGNLVQVKDPDLLLRAWLDEYDFGKHRRIAGHIPARDGADLLRMLAAALGDRPHAPPYAATGLAAGWCLGRYAGFRLASLYVHDAAAVEDLVDLSFRPTERGANVWLLVPDDPGVFHGAKIRGDVHCVAPVQAYLDLHSHPERAEEVAAEIKRDYLHWVDVL